VAHSSPLRAEAAKRARLMERLFACCDGPDTFSRCDASATDVSVPWTSTERMHACHAIMSLLEDTSAMEAWAGRLAMLNGPVRAFRSELSMNSVCCTGNTCLCLLFCSVFGF